MKMFVFAYGSLLNPQSRQKTLSGNREIKSAILRGYRRKMNAPVNGYLYLNIIPEKTKNISGKIIAVTRAELEMLKLREPGYACVNVTEKLRGGVCGVAYAFIAPDVFYPNLAIPGSYIATCLAGMSEVEKKKWFAETIIENEILNDLECPVYENAA